jgi:hypothetical protein
MALILSAAAPAAPAVTYEPSSFCSGGVVRDFLAPLTQMPKLHSPPATGRVGFGPARLIIRSRPQLVVDEREVGYTLALGRSQSAHLDWDIVTTLTLIDRHGESVEAKKRVRRHLETVRSGHGGGVRLPVGPEPAFYRLTSVFRNSSGQKLGGYGFYFRVVVPTERARLVLLEDSVRPSQLVSGRIENLGTRPVSYGTFFAIERFDGAAWTLAPESPPGPWLAVAFQVLPGAAGKCSIFQVPASMPPGHYRMTKSTGPRGLSAEFDVVP